MAVTWADIPGIRSLYTLRTGGVSLPPRDSLNLGDHVRDMPAAVAANRERLRIAAQLPAEPVWLRQVHGVAVADLDADLPPAAPPVADAAVATQPGRLCTVMTADCLPVLFAAADGSAVAAAHAGWRGLAAGVLESTVAALRIRAPSVPLLAWLGPAIGPYRFEVGPEVREAFLTADAEAGSAFKPVADGRWLCDLYALARRRLDRLQVTVTGGGDQCTYTDETRFFSHRRDVQHRGLDDTGRMAALIWRQT